jgi:hypothetical protein
MLIGPRLLKIPATYIAAIEQYVVDKKAYENYLLGKELKDKESLEREIARLEARVAIKKQQLAEKK